MAKAVLLALLTLCFTRVFHMAFAASNQLKCEPGGTNTYKIDKAGTYEIVCPEGTRFPAPQEVSAEGIVSLTPECTDNQSVRRVGDLVPGAGIGKKEEEKTVLVISQLPGDPRKFYIPCSKDANQEVNNKCVITVEVASRSPVGSNESGALVVGVAAHVGAAVGLTVAVLRAW